MVGKSGLRVSRGLRVLLAALFLVGGFTTAQTSANLRQTVTREPGNLHAWIDLGNALLQENKFDEAQKGFLEAVGLDYRSGDAHFGLGLAEYGRGDYPAALFQFNEVTRLYPERFDGHFNRGVTLAKLRRHDEAVEAFGTALQNTEEVSSGEQVNAYLGLAGQLERVEDFAAAADAYTAALELRPGDDALTLQRGEALYKSGNGLEALPELTDLETRSKDYLVSTLVADIYVQADQPDYAVSSLERALRNAQAARETGAQASILVKLGLLQRSLGRDAEAVSAFQRATAADANSWQARYNLGVSYLENGEPESALGHLENAATIKPDSGEAHLALATAYDGVGRSADAFTSAQTALAALTDPELLAQANFIVGRGLYGQGDYAGAFENFEAVLMVRPDSAAAQLWAGLSEYQQANYDAAVQYIERSVQLEPSNLDARVNLGAAYLASERYQDAELVYQMLVEDAPQNADSFYNLGWALYAQNQREDAKEAWVRASDLGFGPAQNALQKYF
ncbi:tetratricopeptide repeat protein [soil metagenome]